MEIQGEYEAQYQFAHQPHHNYHLRSSYSNIIALNSSFQNGSSKVKEAKVSHSLTVQEMRVLKNKQQKNILNKIQRIVQKVNPIHQAEYESQNENDMHDLIEQFQKMDIE